VGQCLSRLNVDNVLYFNVQNPGATLDMIQVAFILRFATFSATFDGSTSGKGVKYGKYGVKAAYRKYDRIQLIYECIWQI
jgi:hypothetical protein